MGGLHEGQLVARVVDQKHTVEEVEQRMREAILFHLEGMREDHLPLPQPTSRAEYIDVSIPA